MNNLNIVPKPAKIIINEGEFLFNNNIAIFSEDKLKALAIYLKEILSQATSFEFAVKEVTKKFKGKDNAITLELSNINLLNPESYTLEVNSKNIKLKSQTPSGIFYGIQTLKQLLPLEIEKKGDKLVELSVPCVKIEDFSRFPWRGFMLDESRHFFGKELVKKILDIMSSLKLNVFHWHITDDQGWRVEIIKYPLLTDIGSKREGTITRNRELDGIPISGYYSQEDVKEIIEYATQRYINIVPEIDVPGHTTALLASYPELSCTGGPFEVSTRFGIHKEVLCVGKENTFNFVIDVLKEIIEVFPSEIIHLGGDEVSTRRWKKCVDCQSRIKTNGLKDERELQFYFTNRVANYLASRGKKLMGWNEILNKNLSIDAICQFWFGDFDLVLEHIKNGRKVVMSDRSTVYLDYSHINLPLVKTYEYDPIPMELEEKYRKNILGIEACLWTEFVSDSKRVERQAFPRLIAIAETGWSLKENKNFESFKNRVNSFLKRLNYRGTDYNLSEIN